MGHGANHQLLRVRRHTPASNEDNKAWDEVALRPAVSVPAEPHTNQTSTPPDDTHGRVLPVVSDPGRAPAMLREGVDTTPSRDDGTVEEFLTAARTAEPDLANEQKNGEQHAIGDEGTAHDKVRQALAKMVALAEAQSRDATKDHLYPCIDGERLAVDAV